MTHEHDPLDGTSTTLTGELQHHDGHGLAATTGQVERLTREAVDQQPVDLPEDGQYRIVTVPDGYHATVAQVVVPQRHAAQPDRRRGETAHESAASLARYVTEHHDPAATTVWVHVPRDRDGEIVAVLDDHHAVGAGWSEHRVHLPLQTSTAWRYWLGRDGRLLSHVDFSEHLEAGIAEIADPPAAKLLELVNTLQYTRNVKFDSSVAPGGGSTVTYHEEEGTKSNRGKFDLPPRFSLRLPVFPGSAALDVVARFRHRVSAEGKLQIGYQIDRPENVIEGAVEQIVEELTALLPEPVRGRVYRGRPISSEARLASESYVDTNAVGR